MNNKQIFIINNKGYISIPEQYEGQCEGCALEELDSCGLIISILVENYG